MMIRFLVTVMLASVGALHGIAQQAAPPATAEEMLTNCVQVQPVVRQLLDGASVRLQDARQSNSASALRAAVDDLDGTLRDLRARLAPCDKVEPADAHAGHSVPSLQRAPAAAPGKPAISLGTHTQPPAAAAPAAKPPAGAVDPHAGHAMPPAKPAPPSKPATARPPAAAKPPAKPHTEHIEKSAPRAANAAAVDPVCGMKIDPETAPSAMHAGQTYHFCSTQHQQLFRKTPSKYVLPK